MSKYTIIHGQLTRVSDDELMHWKYVRKERKNGVWRYYYDDSSNYYDHKYDKLTYQRDKNKAKTLRSLVKVGEAEYKLERKRALSDGNISLDERKELDETAEVIGMVRAQQVKSGITAVESRKTFMRNTMTHVTQSIISRGVVAVKNLFSSLTAKKQKAAYKKEQEAKAKKKAAEAAKKESARRQQKFWRTK